MRGLGVLNIRTIFGETAVRPEDEPAADRAPRAPAAGGRDAAERLPLARARRGDPRRHRAQGDDPGRRRPQPRGAGRGRGAQLHPAAARHRLHGRVHRAPEAARCRKARSSDGERSAMQLVLVSGLSGSGKSIALQRARGRAATTASTTCRRRCCSRWSTSSPTPGHERVAVSVDARSAALAALPEHIARAAARAASTAACCSSRRAPTTLMRRFSETRRRHPLAGGELTLPEAIERERELLAGVAPLGHRIDTSELQPRVLRNWIRDLLGLGARRAHAAVRVVRLQARHPARRRLGVRRAHACPTRTTTRSCGRSPGATRR